jgi:hypothetical protein
MLRFDDSLGVCRAVLKEFFGDALPETTIVRDPTGTLTVVLPDGAVSPNRWDELAGLLHRRLGRYSPGNRRVVLGQQDLIDAKDVLESPDRIQLPRERPAEPRTWLLDRLLTNQDWLRQPLRAVPPLPLATAFSVKGGVGRSTALAALAWFLARDGRRVLVVDLDLEAPGLAALLLDNLPDYGMVDWLVEMVVGDSGETTSGPAPLADMIGMSPLASDETGRIEVLPAFGGRTRNFVAKLGRIYLPGVDGEARPLGLRDRLGTLLDTIAARPQRPDVVLLDSRAGLHDIGAAAVTQLGAEVFLFGRDEPQAWQALGHLFDHLSFARSVVWGAPDSDLRRKLHMVAAQLGPTAADATGWSQASYEVWSRLFDEEREDDPQSSRPFVFDPNDPSSPHVPLPINFDPLVRGARFTDPATRPSWEVIERAFGGFLAGAAALLPGDVGNGGQGA